MEPFWEEECKIDFEEQILELLIQIFDHHVLKKSTLLGELRLKINEEGEILNEHLDVVLQRRKTDTRQYTLTLPETNDAGKIELSLLPLNWGKGYFSLKKSSPAFLTFFFLFS